MDDQICAVNRRTGEEKVCCRNEVDLDEQETSGGHRVTVNGVHLTDTSIIGGIRNIDSDSVFKKCSSM